jgi:hypothetical protein
MLPSPRYSKVKPTNKSFLSIFEVLLSVIVEYGFYDGTLFYAIDIFSFLSEFFKMTDWIE